MAKSLPMNIPMMGQRQRPVKTKLLMLDDPQEPGAAAEGEAAI